MRLGNREITFMENLFKEERMHLVNLIGSRSILVWTFRDLYLQSQLFLQACHLLCAYNRTISVLYEGKIILLNILHGWWLMIWLFNCRNWTEELGIFQCPLGGIWTIYSGKTALSGSLTGRNYLTRRDVLYGLPVSVDQVCGKKNYVLLLPYAFESSLSQAVED